ncbi:BON domain-containing protein [Flavobacterium sp. 14A]|uniref:BON domain-containing protein n=1 Tax=Flavobacterium sp. 14A TaxID=2735896 RepID=UPI00156FCEFE|nr:BON domain-containing protein [Flavobacterium sp. 14A]NRT10821.1 osmotically-inducible protein OsmY [Flavobacterium sp. 14A]
MRTDLSIKENVLEELQWQPNIDEIQIGVIVKDGIVTLSGIVDSYVKKQEAEMAARSVVGVKGVAEDIEVKYGTTSAKSDTEIATAAVNALKCDISVPENKVQLQVDNGWVYLNGEVEWDFEKNAAKKAIENLTGVRYVMNNIVLKNTVNPIDIKEKIKKAFERSADIDAGNITVKADGHTIKLTGKVRSMKEKDKAKTTAYYAPGVWRVENKLEVE